MRIADVVLPAFIIAGSLSDALACACCTDPGQRYVDVEALDSFRRDEIEHVRFAEEANLYLTEAGIEAIKGIVSAVERYGLNVTWEESRVLFALDDGQGHAGTLSLTIPGKISIFEVDPRDGSDHGHGPVLYKEWKLTGKVAGTGVFAAASEPKHLLTLILQGRGIGCTDAAHFGHWTLVMQGPMANYTLFGDLVRP